MDDNYMRNINKKIELSYKRKISRLLSLITGRRFPDLPRLKGHPLFGRLPYLLKDDGVLENLFQSGKIAESHQSGMCYYWVGHKCILLITKPEHLHELFIAHHDKIGRDSAYQIFKKFLGPNITVDHHDLWKKKKDVYSNWLYKSSALTQHEKVMQKLILQHIASIEKENSSLVHLNQFFGRFALDVLLQTVILPMQNEPRCLEALLHHQHKATQEIFEFRNVFKWLMPKIMRSFLFSGENQDLASLKCKMQDNFNNILLKPNQNDINEHPNFIRSIHQIDNDDSTLSILDNPNVYGDTNMMLLAGLETSISTFQFAIKLLQANPEKEARLKRELRMQEQLNPICFTELAKLPYLDAVIKETLRLYPPVPFLPRDVLAPCSIGNIQLDKGDIVVFSPYLTHRSPVFWSEPEKFKPERFLEEQHIPQLSYFPFGAGANMCIGRRFAWQELTLMLATLYQQFDIQLDNNNFELSLAQGALKPKQPVQARFESSK